MPDSIHPWEGLEDGRLEYLTGRPLNWPHYTSMTVEVVLSMSFSRDVVFPYVEETEDHPELAETTVTETHDADMSAAWTWSRETAADEVFGATTGVSIPANKFRMFLTVGGGSEVADFPKAWNFAVTGPSGTATGGTITLVTKERSYASATYGSIITTTTPGAITAVWNSDEYGVLETFLGDWITAFNQVGGGSTGVSFSTTGPGLPTSPPLNYAGLKVTNTAPPAGASLMVTATASETTPVGDPTLWHGTATTTITLTLST